MADMKLTGGHNSSVLCVNTQKETGQIVSGGEDGNVCLWAPEGEIITQFRHTESECTSVIFSKDNPNIVYAAFGEEIQILDINRVHDPICTLKSNSDEINHLAYDLKEQFLGACDDSGEIKVYSIQEKKVFKTLRHKHTNICSTICFRPGRPWELISGGLDCQLVHWDFSKAKCFQQFNTQELFPTPGESPHMINPPFVHHIAFSPDGEKVACALENGQIPILDSSKKHLKPMNSLFAHTQGVSQVLFLDVDVLISAGNDSCIYEWDLSKASLYSPNIHCTKGDGIAVTSSPEEEQALAISDLCRVQKFSRDSKINWLAANLTDTERRLYIADETPDISIIIL